MSEAEKPPNLGDSLLLQMARVRDEVMPPYRDIGREGAPALMMMRRALDCAAKAILDGDIAGMIHWHEELKGFSL